MFKDTNTKYQCLTPSEYEDLYWLAKAYEFKIDFLVAMVENLVNNYDYTNETAIAYLSETLSNKKELVELLKKAEELMALTEETKELLEKLKE